MALGGPTATAHEIQDRTRGVGCISVRRIYQKHARNHNSDWYSSSRQDTRDQAHIDRNAHVHINTYAVCPPRHKGPLTRRHMSTTSHRNIRHWLTDNPDGAWQESR